MASTFVIPQDYASIEEQLQSGLQIIDALVPVTISGRVGTLFHRLMSHVEM
jgi:hypothetical protein